MTPDTILSWWDVIDRIGLVGVLLAGAVWAALTIWRYLPSYKERIIVDSDMNKFLEQNQKTLEDLKDIMTRCTDALGNQ